MSDVTFVRSELSLMLTRYELIDDCVSGQDTVKAAKTKYLPKPNASDTSQQNTDRYTSYVERAVFYNVTKRTLAGLTGLVFSISPEARIPEALDPLVADVDGSGVSLEQSAKKSLKRNIAKGRGGLLTDFPNTGGRAVTRAELRDGRVRPTILNYDPEDIINWRVKARGAEQVLSLVVLRETYDAREEDFFATDVRPQYRVLFLDDADVYRVEIYRPDSTEGSLEIPVEEFTPTQADGSTFDYIPFTFYGAENNDADIDEPPLYDIATINIGHYRNSADYEESSYQVGNPTPWMSGLTESWVKNVLKGQVFLGTRAVLPLPENGKAGLLQAQPNSMPFEAMKHKEQQMVALGAKLIDPKTIEITATEANYDNHSENSVLASSATNVAEAYAFALKQAALFVGADPDEVFYTLNTDFKTSSMTSEDRRQLVNEWMNGAISYEEVRASLRKTGVAILDDEEAKTKIEAEFQERQERVQTEEPENDNDIEPDA